ncbi:hypothetical protein [Vitreimonas sp.]|uniref:hypothetical protein n=1 Tax=Vitreimonas sp. TaxID=3069702 RepID=UPI002ED8ADF4
MGEILSWSAIQLGANWVSLVGALISVISAFAAAAQRRNELRIARIKDLIAWANEGMAGLALACVEVSRGEFRDAVESPASDRRASIRARLSAAVDQGRLFFENKQSFRPDVLDPLVRAFDLMLAAERHPDRYTVEHLEACMSRHRSDFWKMVQKKVDPEWMRKAVQGPQAVAGSGAWDFDRQESLLT